MKTTLAIITLALCAGAYAAPVTQSFSNIKLTTVPVESTPADVARMLTLDATGTANSITPAVMWDAVVASGVSTADITGLDTSLAGKQPLDADLTSIASLTTTTYGRSLLTLADAAAGRSSLGLGTMATETATNYLTTTAATAGYQPLDADLTALAALTTTTYGRSLTTLADAAALRTAGGLVIGTDVQANDSDLTSIAALSTTSYGRSFLTQADASAGRTYLGLGTMATEATASYLTTAGIAAAYQPLDSDLTAIAAITTTSYGRSTLALADAAAGRTLFGLGGLAVLSTATAATGGTGIDTSGSTGFPKIAGGTWSVENAATHRGSIGGTTVGQAFFTLTDPGAITFPRINADNSVSALSAAAYKTALGITTGSGDVVGPASATDNAAVLFDSTTGKLIKDSTLVYSSSRLQLGGAAASPGTFILTGQEGTGSNISATTLQITGPRGTGTGTPGEIEFLTGVSGASGASAHTLTSRFKITGTSAASFVAQQSTSTSSQIKGARGAAGTPALATENNHGLYSIGTGEMGVSVGGNAKWSFKTDDFFSNADAQGNIGVDTSGPTLKRPATINASSALTAPTVRPYSVTGTNAAGTDLTIAAGLGTGTGTPTSVIIKAPPVTGAGSGAQTASTLLTLNAAGITTASAVPFTQVTNSLGTTTAAGIILSNTTAAAAGAQQITPGLDFVSNGWKTNATAGSQETRFRIVNLPVQGAAAPTAALEFRYGVNGATPTTFASFNSTGYLKWADGLGGSIGHITGPGDQNLSFKGGTSTGAGRGFTFVASDSVPYGAGGGFSVVTGGAAGGYAATGSISLTTANGPIPGSITIATGNGGNGGAFSATVGTITVNGGSGASYYGAGTTGNTGGSFTSTMGNGGPGGFSGTSSGGLGGSWTAAAGTGGTVTTTTTLGTAGNGGVMSLASGGGGGTSSTTTAAVAGNGGAASFVSGAGGVASVTSGTGTGGNSGVVTIGSGNGGNGPTVNGNSSDVNIVTGTAGAGAGSAGTIGSILVKPGGTEKLKVATTGVTIGQGTAITKVLSATAALDFGSTGAGAVADLTITVTGAALGDVVALGVPHGSITATADFFGWVSAADTVTVRFSPKATEDPASGTFRVMVTKF